MPLTKRRRLTNFLNYFSMALKGLAPALGGLLYYYMRSGWLKLKSTSKVAVYGSAGTIPG